MLIAMDQAYTVVSDELDHVECFFDVRNLFFETC